MLVSGTEVELGMWAAHEHLFDLDQVGSAAYKLARLAAGFGDAFVSLRPKHEWDICAGVALVLAAGGRVTDLTGRPIRFNLAAANAALHAALIDLLQGG
jgi:myo-inositol-1(or 4)-monophosphatase